MLKVNVLYPAVDGAQFDMNYYLNQHTPMLRDRFGPALKSIAIEHGLAGPAPDTAASFIVLCHLGFASVEAFQTAFAPHAAEIMGDIANYTNVQPVIQISDVKL